ncbi:MAG: hypothetical protein ABIU09_07225 [Pyrinomonadaceae bacterium]
MIDAAAIGEIIALYKKHGWTLRRVLLSAPLGKSLLTGDADIFGDTDVRASELDAAWFSRSSTPERTAWEIRHLSGTPYALVEVIENGTDAQFSDKVLEGAEARMKETILKRRAN